MPTIIMVSLNHPSHRKCIGFADLQADFFATEPARCCMKLCNSRNSIMKFQHIDSKFKTIGSVIVELMEPKSLNHREGWTL